MLPQKITLARFACLCFKIAATFKIVAEIKLSEIAATFKIAAEIIKNCSRSYQKLQQKLSKITATFKIAACPLWAAVVCSAAISRVGILYTKRVSFIYFQRDGSSSFLQSTSSLACEKKNINS